MSPPTAAAISAQPLSPSAMARPLTVNQLVGRKQEIRLSPWHHVGDDSSLEAFTLDGRPILLDLTDGDTFLQISKAFLKPLKLHKDSDVTYALITLSIPKSGSKTCKLWTSASSTLAFLQRL